VQALVQVLVQALIKQSLAPEARKASKEKYDYHSFITQK
jgi:hypothetical protein